MCVCGGGGSGLLKKASIGKSEEDYSIWTMENIFLGDIQYSN